MSKRIKINPLPERVVIQFKLITLALQYNQMPQTTRVKGATDSNLKRSTG